MTDVSDNRILLFSAPLVIPVTGPAIRDGAVAVKNGRILHVGTQAWVASRLKDEAYGALDVEHLAWDGIVTPGLVNAHTHLQYTGMFSVGRGSYENFRAWELGFNAIYDDPAPKPWRRWAMEGARMLVEAGTTAAADIVTDVEASDALISSGLHGISYWEVMDWGNDEWVRDGEQTLMLRLYELRRHGVGTLGISPHAPYSLEVEPLLDLPDIARRLGMRLHIHLGETPAEAGADPEDLTNLSGWEWSQRRWPGYNTLAKAGAPASSIQFMDQLAMLGPDVHIAHGVYASKEDRRILRQRGVSVALCPRSNVVTCVGAEAPVAAYLREGNAVAVGTDSLSSSPSLDVLDDLALVWDIARGQGYDEPDLSHRLIRMATLGGAEAMGLNVGPDRIGQINVGAMADLAFFDIAPDVSRPEGVEEAFEEFVRHGAGRCRATVSEGRILYDRIWG